MASATLLPVKTYGYFLCISVVDSQCVGRRIGARGAHTVSDVLAKLCVIYLEIIIAVNNSCFAIMGFVSNLLL